MHKLQTKPLSLSLSARSKPPCELVSLDPQLLPALLLQPAQPCCVSTAELHCKPLFLPKRKQGHRVKLQPYSSALHISLSLLLTAVQTSALLHRAG